MLELLSVKAKLINEVKGHRKHRKLKWNADSHWLSLKALGLVFLAATLAPSRPYGTKDSFYLAYTEERQTGCFLKKPTTMLRTGTTESTCTPHKLTIYFF